MNLFRPATVVLSLAALATGALAQTRLGIRRIVLYKHGVGYFERQGTVSGVATIPLAFKAAQMKDVLKSLYAVDLGGGRISTIVYDSKDPVEKQLEDIRFDVPENNALTQFLKQLKGAKVRVEVGTQKIEGQVLGIEPVQERTEHGVTTTYKLVLLRSDGAIQPVELFEASNIEILDEGVRRDLGRMMEIYAKARYADRKVVQLRAEGTGRREVRAGYIIETPIWKTSYRLLLDRDAPPLLQGWAIVENRTDEDWEDVQLTFVAGSPLSFVLDLYTSYYPQRPVVAMEIAAAESGVLPPGAPSPSQRRGARTGRGRFRADAPAEKAKGALRGPVTGGVAFGELLEQSMAPVTQGVAVGDLFAYEAQGPVTIKQGQAALVPILLERLTKGGKILYYRRQLSVHPSHAFDLRNATDLTLEKGPVTVFEGATCLGEGMMQKTLKTGMHSVVPYALEPGVEVEPRTESRNEPVTRAVLMNGVLTLERSQVLETRYRLRNKTGKAYTLWLDHPKAQAPYKLVEPAKAQEELSGVYRFATELAGDANVVYRVQERRRLDTQVSLFNQSSSQIRVHLKEPHLSDRARQLLTRIAGLMDQKAGLERQMRTGVQETERLTRDQDRIRKNVAILRDSPGERTMREKYLARLLKGDERLDELQRQARELAKLQENLEAQIRGDLRAFRD